MKRNYEEIICRSVQVSEKRDDSMAVDKSLISGSTMMLLMKLLEGRDMYGYEMIESLRSRSENVFELKAGTLYPLLHTMESKGYVASYEREASGKTRKYYSLTKAGKKQLREKEEEWKEYTRAVSSVMGGVCYGEA